MFTLDAAEIIVEVIALPARHVVGLAVTAVQMELERRCSNTIFVLKMAAAMLAKIEVETRLVLATMLVKCSVVVGWICAGFLGSTFPARHSYYEVAACVFLAMAIVSEEASETIYTFQLHKVLGCLVDCAR